MSENEIVNRVYGYIDKHDRIALAYDDDVLKIGKYDRYVPESLLLREYAESKLDLDLEL